MSERNGSGVAIKPRPYQQECVDSKFKFWAENKGKSSVDVLPTAAGKCLAPDTPIVLYSGEIIKASEVRIGDVLLGDDNTRRTVTSVYQGQSDMFDIEPLQKGFDSWSCNDEHILTLVGNENTTHFKKNEVFDVSIKHYLDWKKTPKHCAKQFATGFDGWPEAEQSLPSYLVGLWLGDGTRRSPTISTTEPEVFDYLIEFCTARGLIYTRRENITCPSATITTPSGQRNPVHAALQQCVNDDEMKFIPKDYLVASRSQRLDLLAGLLDSDGYCSNGTGHEIVQKSLPLAEGVVFLARSLGFSASMTDKVVNGETYNRIYIAGNFENVPFKVPRRIPTKKTRKNPLRSAFKVKPAGHGSYIGISVDGNKRFLKGDFTVVHNTVIASLLFQRLHTEYPRTQSLFLAHRKELIEQTEKKLLSVWPDAPVGVYAAGMKRKEIAPIVIASRDTMAPALNNLRYAPHCVLVDECHNVSTDEASRYVTMIREFKSRFKYFNLNGTTATPFRQGSGMIAGIKGAPFDDISYRVYMRQLLDEGFLAPVVTPDFSDNAKVDLSGLRASPAGLYNENELAARSINLELIRASIKVWRTLAYEQNRKHTMFFCVNIKHAEAVQDELAIQGFNFPLVTGNTPTEERARICEEYLHGCHAGILNVGVFTEGTDFPLIDCIVNLRAVASLSLWLQMVGRGMRISPETGKKDCLLLDMGGCLDLFGPIDTASPPTKGEPDKRTKTCPECEHVCGYLKRKCPECSFQFEEPVMKACPVCDEECAPSAAQCFACGNIFFSHKKEASTSEAISDTKRFQAHPLSKPVEFQLLRSRVTGKDYLQLVYTSGTKEFTKNLMFDDDKPYNISRAHLDWKNATFSHTPFPDSSRSAARILSTLNSEAVTPKKTKGKFVKAKTGLKPSRFLRGVAQITVDNKSGKNGKYKNITEITFYEGKDIDEHNS